MEAEYERHITRDEAETLARDFVQRYLRAGWTVPTMEAHLDAGWISSDGSDASLRVNRGVIHAPYWDSRWHWRIADLAATPAQLPLFGGAHAT